MTRRIKRLPQFEVTLEILDGTFIAPPRPAQRNWLLNRAMNEFAADLVALDGLAADFVAGSDTVPTADRSQAELDDQDIMEDWQIPIMTAMAAAAGAARGDVLEVGFGRGVSADLLQQAGIRSHTIVECNDAIVRRMEAWKAGYPERDIRLVHARWQDAADQLEAYDAVFFHTYPLTEDEYIDHVVNSTTFAEHFFPTAAAHLREGGVFTYLTNEIDSFSRAHQRLVFRYFRSLTLSLVTGLQLPADLKDAWWADSMVVIRAVK